MRIGLVSDCYLPRLGGIELQVHDLALQLRLAGHSATVLTTTAGEETDGVQVLRYPTLAGVPTPGALADLRRAWANGRYDVLHVHTSLFSPLAWSAARTASAAGMPILITMHSLPAPGATVAPQLLAQLDHGLGTNVRWTAVSETAAVPLRRVLRGRRVDVLHNGIDPTPWQRAAERAPQGPLTIVSTMRLAHRKRPGALLRTLEDIRRRTPDAVPLRAIVAGSGPRTAAIARTVRRRGLAGWVELPGRLSRRELQQLYAVADVYLAPAELESFGLAALEARCAGLAVVAMASGGVGEFVRDGDEGFLVDDDRAMAATATALLTDREMLRRIQRHNRTTLPAMTWDAVVDQHLQAYHSLLSASSQRRPVVLQP